MGQIFVVDDEVFIQELYQSMLPVGGHVVIDTASNGQEAVDKFTAFRCKPDLTLMDHRMPIMNGLEATGEILEREPGARVLVISADATVQPQCLACGAAGFLEKPFSMDLLFSSIDITMRNGSANRTP